MKGAIKSRRHQLRRQREISATLTVIEWLTYLIAYAASTMTLLLTRVMDTDDCQADRELTFPGGCSQYTAVTDFRFVSLSLVQLFLLVAQLTLFAKFKIRRPVPAGSTSTIHYVSVSWPERLYFYAPAAA